MPLCTMQKRISASETVCELRFGVLSNKQQLSYFYVRLPTHPYNKAFTFCPQGGGGGHFHLNLYGVFQGIIFQHNFLNGVSKLIRNSETGYDYLFKNNMLLFSRTTDHCFPLIKVSPKILIAQ